jgi:hypothetical protein
LGGPGRGDGVVVMDVMVRLDRRCGKVVEIGVFLRRNQVLIPLRRPLTAKKKKGEHRTIGRCLPVACYHSSALSIITLPKKVLFGIVNNFFRYHS